MGSVPLGSLQQRARRGANGWAAPKGTEHDPAAPLLQIATPAFDGTCSGSLGPLDMAVDAASNTLRILAAGLNYHENICDRGLKLIRTLSRQTELVFS